jgi:hypothetical protein
MSQPPPLPPLPPPPAPRKQELDFAPEPRDFDDEAPRRSRRRRDEDRDDDDDDDRRRQRQRRRRASSGNSWGTASTGMKMMFGSVIGMMLAFMIILPTTFHEPAIQDPFQAAPRQQNPIATLGGCIVIIAAIVSFIGACMCCAAPDRSAHRWALSSLLTAIGSFLFMCILFVIVAAAIGANANQNQNFNAGNLMAMGIGMILVLIVGALIMLASFVFWMLFHASVARALGNDSLLHQSYWYIAAPFVQQGLNFVIGLVAGIQIQRGNPLSGFGNVLVHIFQMVLMLAVSAWYAAICWQTFRTMDLGGSGGSRDDFD